VVVALLSSFVVVALAEMGDKTQLVALSMASRYRRPWAVLLGILIATTVNHALASSVGVWAATRMPAAVVQWVLALGFIGFGVWTLVPDSSVELARLPAWGPLVTKAVVFFLADLGVKTQLATVAFAARFGPPGGRDGRDDARDARVRRTRGIRRKLPRDATADGLDPPRRSRAVLRVGSGDHPPAPGQ